MCGCVIIQPHISLQLLYFLFLLLPSLVFLRLLLLLSLLLLLLLAALALEMEAPCKAISTYLRLIESGKRTPPLRLGTPNIIDQLTARTEPLFRAIISSIPFHIIFRLGLVCHLLSFCLVLKYIPPGALTHLHLLLICTFSLLSFPSFFSLCFYSFLQDSSFFRSSLTHFHPSLFYSCFFFPSLPRFLTTFNTNSTTTTMTPTLSPAPSPSPFQTTLPP